MDPVIQVRILVPQPSRGNMPHKRRVMSFRRLIHFSFSRSLHGERRFWVSFYGNSVTCIELGQAKALAKWLRELADWVEERAGT